MSFRTGLFIYCACQLFHTVSAQLVFSAIPSDLQMIPRDQNNMGLFTVSGSCTDPSILALRFVLRMNKDTSVYMNRLVTIETNGLFSVNLSIPAGLADYDLRVYAAGQGTTEVLKKTVKELVCGDFFIATGQSNASGALEYNEGIVEDSLYSNRYCRTIGSSFQWSVAKNENTGEPNFSIEEDCRFLRPSCMYTGSDKIGSIGIWPLRMMFRVVKETGIPACIINGAMGATELTYHLATHTPSDPDHLKDNVYDPETLTPSSYDRLFKKIHVNNAAMGVKAIFWYQGESDGNLGREHAENYNNRFALLRKSWKLDYPRLEKIFVFQLNTGCGGNNLSLLREQQRKMPELFNDVIVLPTVGSRQNERAEDGCHYTAAGQRKLGENMAPVVLKYLYHVNFEDKQILGPNVEKAYYSKPGRICIEFNMDVKVQQSMHFTFQNEGTAYIKDCFYKKDKQKLHLRSVAEQGNKVFLDLSDSIVEITKLTYLPDIFSEIPTTYMGPWILNKNNENLGALSFFEFPVKSYSGHSWRKNDSLVVYPNPAREYFAIRTTEGILLDKVILYNISGKKILERNIKEPSENLIDMQGFENGIYFLVCYSGENIFKRKIVLLH